MTDLRTLAGGVAATVRVELRRLARRRAALVVTFLSPLLITAIVVVALGDQDGFAPSRVGFVVDDPDASTELFVAAVVGRDELDGFVEWVELDDSPSAASAVADEEVGAAIVVTPGTTSGAVPDFVVLGDEDPVAAGVAASIVDEYRVTAAANALATARGLEPPPTARGLRFTAPGGRSVDASVHWGPALGAFFVLLSMGYAAHRRVSDRQEGIAARTAATPSGPGAVLIGQAAAAAAIGTAALLVMAGGSQLLFGRSWGPWPAVLLVAAATGVAVAGVASAVAAASRTPGQAQTLTAVAAFVLAIGGGSFSPPGSVGEPGPLTRWLPTTLSLDGFSVTTTTGEWAALGVPVTALIATGIALFLVALPLGRRIAS